MEVIQRQIRLKARARGCHLVTKELLDAIPELTKVKGGLLNIFLQHTSASLTLNENWDPDVREDMASTLDSIVPEHSGYKHSCEGPDDMPAHVKSSLLGASLTIPVSEGKLMLGTWQGIWLCEHRDHASSRSIFFTLFASY
jgi:secondary thiamine-phosphate synthase enzyme